MYRKGAYIVGRIAGLLAVLLMGAVVAIQMPYVQTRLSKIALNQLASILDGRIQYDELKVMTSGVLVIRNLALVDNAPYTEDIYERGWAPDDTVFRARSITATFAIDGLLKGEGIHLGRVTVEDGYMHLISEPVAPGNNLTRILKLTPPEEPVEPAANLFDIKKVRIKNFRFRLTSFLESKVSKRYDAPHIDFEDLDVTADITAHNLKMAGGVMSGVCDKLTAREKSGFTVQDLTGSAEVGQGKVLIEDLHLCDLWSDIQFRTLLMSFKGPEAFADFLNAVKLDGDIQRSRIAMQTISYFSGGSFEGSPLVFNVQRGRPQGYVSHFQVNKMTFTEQHSNVSAIIDGSTSGLPDVMQFALNLQVKDLVATTDGISRIITGFAPTAKLNLGQLAHNLPLTLQVKTEGLLNELGFSGEMETPDGAAGFTGNIRYILDPHRPIELTAALNTRELDLGRVLGNDSFGPVSLTTRARAVLKNGLPDADVDTLQIDRIRAFGHDFQNINVGGGLGVSYDHPNRQPIPNFHDFFKTYATHLRLRPGQNLHFELGRAVVAQMGSLITKVLYVKQGTYKQFVIVDAGMTDLIRPALYQAYHKIENLSSDEPAATYDVVGPICESSDVFAKAVDLNTTHRGDLIALRSAGAYGEIMASQYNCRPLPKGYITEDFI